MGYFGCCGCNNSGCNNGCNGNGCNNSGCGWHNGCGGGMPPSYTLTITDSCGRTGTATMSCPESGGCSGSYNGCCG